MHRSRIKQFLARIIPHHLYNIIQASRCVRPLQPRHCPVCNYQGYFRVYGNPPRLDALCPQCGSLERHRLFWIWFKVHAPSLHEPVLHFAPEAFLEPLLRKHFKNYRTADLHNPADLCLNIEDTGLEKASIRCIIANHILEHVNDQRALAELHRLLSDDGVLLLSVPLVEGWDSTYENPAITSAALRRLHFGQEDHVRLYGRDFTVRLNAAGFTVETIVAKGEECAAYGLSAGDKFFVCCKV